MARTFTITTKRCEGAWLGSVRRGRKIIARSDTLRKDERTALLDAAKLAEAAIKKASAPKRRKK